MYIMLENEFVAFGHGRKEEEEEEIIQIRGWLFSSFIEAFSFALIQYCFIAIIAKMNG